MSVLVWAWGCNAGKNADKPLTGPPLKLGRTIESIDSNPLIFFQDSKSNYWFGGKAVYKYDGKQITEFTEADGLCSGGIIGIQEGADGAIYFDTEEGVCRFDHIIFTELPIDSSDSPQAGWALNEHDLWFRGGWSRNGPLRYDGKVLYQLEFPHHPRADSFYRIHPGVPWSPYGIYSIYRDQRGDLWFGTAALGAVRYNGESFDWLYEEHLSLTPAGGSFGIRSIVEDADGYYWICNTRFRYNIDPTISGSTDVSYMKKAGTPASVSADKYPYFMSSVRDPFGDLWFATYEEGVWRKHGDELIHYPLNRNGQQVLAFTIAIDNSGVIWLLTHNAGILRFINGKFTAFSP